MYGEVNQSMSTTRPGSASGAATSFSLQKEIRMDGESEGSTTTNGQSLPIGSMESTDSESLSQAISSPMRSSPGGGPGWPPLIASIRKPARLNLPKHVSSGENLIGAASPNDKSYCHYIPRWVIHNVITQDTSQDSVEALSQECQAAVMCIDIVGFTALTGLLGTSGNAEGAENISQVLNTYFGKVLEIIESFDGDVIQFSGDAIMALFAGKSGIEQKTLICVKCAQSISHTLGTTSVSLFGKCVDVSLKVGISSGSVSQIICGGHRNKFMAVVAGEAWADAAIICDECPAGHIAIHGSVAIKVSKKRGVLSSTCCGGKTEDSSKNLLIAAPPFSAVTLPTWRSETPNLSMEQKQQVKQFIPKNIIKGVRNELRSVVTVFIKFCDMEAFPVDVESLFTCSITVQRIAQRYVGYLNKLLYDDKGMLSLICFGVPQYVHADDSERACLLAADLTDALRSKVRLCIGIAKNKVYCGSLGNSFRVEYTVLGDSVNMAARLMAHGFKENVGSCCFVDEAVWSETKEDLPYESVKKILVKGKPAPIIAASLAVQARPQLQTRESSNTEVVTVSPRSSGSAISLGKRFSPRSQASSSQSSLNSSSWNSRGKRLRTAGSNTELIWSYSPKANCLSKGSAPIGSLPRNSIKGSQLKQTDSRLSSDGRTAHVVGMSHYHSQYVAFLNSSSSVLLIEASSNGYGRSATMNYLVNEDPPPQVCSLVAYGQSLARQVPFNLIIHFLREVRKAITVNIDPKAENDDSCHSNFIESCFNDNDSDLLIVIDKILPGWTTGVSYTRRSIVITAENVAASVVKILNRYRSVVGADQLALFVDDLQFTDLPSVQVLALIVSRSSDIRLVGSSLTENTCDSTSEKSHSTSSSDSGEQTSLCAIRCDDFTLLQINLMNKDTATLHYKLFLQAETIEPALRDLLYLHSEGNPQMAELIISTLVDQEYIVSNSEGEATLIRHNLDLSDFMSGLSTVEAAVLKKLDYMASKLGDDVMNFLKGICVIEGNRLDRELLEVMFQPVGTGSEFGSVNLIISDLIRKRILNKLDHNTFSFRTAMLPRVQYSHMLAAERRISHVRVALAMAKLRYDEYTVGMHFYKGEKIEKAVHWFDLALPKAVKNSDFIKASRIVGICRERCETNKFLLSPQQSILASDNGSLECNNTTQSDKYRTDQDHNPDNPTTQRKVSNAGKKNAWLRIQLDLLTTLGDIKRARELTLEWSNVTDHTFEEFFASEFQNFTQSWWQCCCKPKFALIDDVIYLNYIAPIDLSIMCGDSVRFMVLCGVLFRNHSKKNKSKEVKTNKNELINMCAAIALRFLAIGDRKSAQQVFSVLKMPAGDSPWTLPLLMCGVAFQEFQFINDYCGIQIGSFSSFTTMGSTRVDLTFMLLRSLSCYLSSKVEVGLTVLQKLASHSRSSGGRSFLLLSHLLERAFKLTYNLEGKSDTTHSLDLLIMINEDQWCSVTDPCIVGAAHVVSALEPLLGMPSLQRKLSKKTSSFHRETVVRVTTSSAMLTEALECFSGYLQTTDVPPLSFGVLNPFLLPFLYLYIDTIRLLTQRSSIDREEVCCFIYFFFFFLLKNKLIKSKPQNRHLDCY